MPPLIEAGLERATWIEAVASLGRSAVAIARRTAHTAMASALPAAFFGFTACARVFGLWERLQRGEPSLEFIARLGYLLNLVYDALAAVFMALVALLFLIRRPALSGRPSWLADLGAIGGTIIVFGLTAAPRTVEVLPVVLLSSTLLICGLALMLYALSSLGRCFGVMARARGLVVSGPYRFVRHPMYLGEFVAFGAILLTVASPWTVGVYLVFILLQLYRIHCEERTLAVAFPGYADYRARTSRLIPGLF